MNNLNTQLWQKENEYNTVTNSIKALEKEKAEYELMKTQLGTAENKLKTAKTKIELAEKELGTSFSGSSAQDYIKRIKNLAKDINAKACSITDASKEAENEIKLIQGKIKNERNSLLMIRNEIDLIGKEINENSLA